MKSDLDVAFQQARTTLSRVGAAHATGDALALCYATAAAWQFALTEKACFAVLRRVPDDAKHALLHRWHTDPLVACGEALDAMAQAEPIGAPPVAVPPPEAFVLV